MDEWVNLFFLLTSLIGVLTWFVRKLILSPIIDKIDNLTIQLKKINNSYELLSKVLDSHEIKLTSHEEKIKTLFIELEDIKSKK
ncbi:hypothetical protein [Companilactobacillus metriopterae]|uniref:hypothetical protein n=1 Tax=Companilactobacillus metriopterae TaxID=1909267 RepID=UPI00100AC44F|nr:hypothetical protein [Companilactobacillus metriopterae]